MLIEEQGGSVGSSVSPRTTYVLAGKGPGAKLDRAKQLGVRILDEREFLEMFSGVSLAPEGVNNKKTEIKG